MRAGLGCLWALAIALSGAPLWAASCSDQEFDGAAMTVCRVEAGQDDLRLFWKSPEGVAYGGFGALQAGVAAAGLDLVLAMNAGMYHEDYAPVGLYVEAGRELAPLVTRDGPGNFGLLPNGVFCSVLAADSGPTFQIVESRAFAADPPACWMATQSGPMLVIDGDLHPKFLAGSESLNYRNGVGVSADGQVATFVIANDAVNFHSFARMFRDALGLDQALFLDGSISRLYAPQLDRSDLGFPIGPIVGVVEQKE